MSKAVRSTANGPVCDLTNCTKGATCSSLPISAMCWANWSAGTAAIRHCKVYSRATVRNFWDWCRAAIRVGSREGRHGHEREHAHTSATPRFAITCKYSCGCGEIGRRAGFRFLPSLGSHGQTFDRSEEHTSELQ